MKYTGSTDAEGQTKARPGTEKIIDIMHKRWGFTNLGIYANRPMRGSTRLSVHATGRAVDCGIPAAKQKDNKWVGEIFDWLVKNYETLGIEEVHQYWYKDWGRGFRCNRNGKPGVKEWTATENGGTPGGKWLHIELTPEMADHPAKFVEAWKSITEKPA